MDILTVEQFEIEKERLFIGIREGCLFIHPTDTIYGIGCSALSSDAVQKVREIKNRYENPFSVIAPSKDWIKENCVVTKEAEKWLEKIPGPYTLILKLKNKKCVATNVNVGLDSLGVRMPDHWISMDVNELNVPIITTSANKSGEDFMTSLENLDDSVKSKVEFIVYEGEKHGRPSKIVDLTEKEKIIER